MASDKETRSLLARLEKLEKKEAQNEKALAQVKAENEALRKNQKLGKVVEYRTGRQKTIGNMVITERETLFENGTRHTISLQEQYYHRESKSMKLGRGGKISRADLDEVIGFLVQLRDNNPKYHGDTAAAATEPSTDHYMELSKRELEDLCRNKGLATRGNKTDLSKRLIEASHSDNPPAPQSPASAAIMSQLSAMSAADLLALVSQV